MEDRDVWLEELANLQMYYPGSTYLLIPKDDVIFRFEDGSEWKVELGDQITFNDYEIAFSRSWPVPCATFQYWKHVKSIGLVYYCQ